MKARETAEKLALSIKTTTEVEQLSNAYRPAANHGARLYFILIDMVNINPMYQFSLVAFVALFESALHKSMPDTVLTKRVANIISTVTEVVCSYGCIGK